MSPLLQQTPSEPVEIGGFRYTIGMLDATKGYPIYCKLVSQVGKVLEGGGALDGGDDLAVRLLGKALQALSPELVGELIRTFGKSSTVEIDGKWPTVESVFMLHFAGRYGAMMGWLFECLKANFADFLPPNLPAVPGVDLSKLSKSTPLKTGS